MPLSGARDVRRGRKPICNGYKAALAFVVTLVVTLVGVIAQGAPHAPLGVLGRDSLVGAATVFGIEIDGDPLVGIALLDPGMSLGLFV